MQGVEESVITLVLFLGYYALYPWSCGLLEAFSLGILLTGPEGNATFAFSWLLSQCYYQ